MKQLIRAILFLIVGTSIALAQEHYKLPPKEIVDILDAPPPPLILTSPTRTAFIMVAYQTHPPLALLAEPTLKLAGLRLNPRLNSTQRLTAYTGIQVKWIDSGKTVQIELPPNPRLGLPVWSPDGRKIAFTQDTDAGVELWVADAATGKAQRAKGIVLNDVLGRGFEWLKDNQCLLVRLIPAGRGPAPAAPRVPVGPIVDETSGKFSMMATFQDLLHNPHEEDLFAYYAATQLAVFDSRTGALTPIGRPGLHRSADFSPDERYLLVTTLKRPFSYRVTLDNFTKTFAVWDSHGKLVRTIAEFSITDEIPSQGVTTGPRDVEWQPLMEASLVWVEALDGGDPLKKVPFREKLMSLASPFTVEPREILKVQHRFRGLGWTAQPGVALLTEFDRDRRWRTTHLVNLTKATEGKVLFDLSANDAYHDPGRPIIQTRPDGQAIILQDGDWIYLAGRGATPQGDRPFLDKYNLDTAQSERLFICGEGVIDQFLGFVGDSRTRILLRHESKTDPPNVFLMDLAAKTRTALTDYRDPAPQLRGMRKELIKYKRPDGVDLSGTLYLPPDYKEKTRLPLVVWAYPLEYSDPGTAGQVRGSPNGFTFLRGASPIFFVTQGYAVLMDATMPVIGDAETMNNTYVEQVVSAAKAAIDTLDSMGVVDRTRVLVTGHSYGAFMTANLLAHSDLFAAGIARSGAYNRTLTPFGFQSERRSFWEAPELYVKMSPFTYANKIKAPILFIHGEADNNSGTFPIQSERMFQAVKATGGTARLVLLPLEAHGYAARESNLHVLAEMIAWADKYVKNKVTAVQ